MTLFPRDHEVFSIKKIMKLHGIKNPELMFQTDNNNSIITPDNKDSLCKIVRERILESEKGSGQSLDGQLMPQDNVLIFS